MRSARGSHRLHLSAAALPHICFPVVVSYRLQQLEGVRQSGRPHVTNGLSRTFAAAAGGRCGAFFHHELTGHGPLVPRLLRAFLPTVSFRQLRQAGFPKHRSPSTPHSDNINVICPFQASPSLVMSPPTKSWNASTKYSRTDSVGRSLIMVIKQSSRKSPNLSRMAAMTCSRLIEWGRPISATEAMAANQAIRKATRWMGKVLDLGSQSCEGSGNFH